ncbi:MAG: transposase [Nitrospinae bacterium]|nr:transposase [Nitrospinota bacterium]
MVKRFVESGHDKRFLLSVAVVMPDHAHLLLWPKEKYSGVFYSLNDILRPIKGASSRGINLFLGRRGPVWQKESFDRIIRNEREWREKYDYICNNPVKNGLAEKPNEYPWLVFGEQFINRY